MCVYIGLAHAPAAANLLNNRVGGGGGGWEMHHAPSLVRAVRTIRRKVVLFSRIVPESEFDWLRTVDFPSGQLNYLQYHRIIGVLSGYVRPD